MAPRIVSLEGNIGAGKSTLLLELATLGLPEGWVILEEPVDLWDTFRDEDGKTMLEKFYADPHKYAFAFQIMAYTTRLNALQRLIEEQNPAGILCERSLMADHQVFAKMLRDDGCLEKVMYDIYVAQAATPHKQLDAVIYLDVDVETCFSRIAKRGRQGEDAASREYLTKCQTYYASWLTTTHTPVFNVSEGTMTTTTGPSEHLLNRVLDVLRSLSKIF